MTRPLFIIDGDDGESLYAYEATNGTGVVLVPTDRGRPTHGIKLNPERMAELARKLTHEAARLSPDAARRFQRAWAELAQEIATADLPALERRLRDMSTDQLTVHGYDGSETTIRFPAHRDIEPARTWDPKGWGQGLQLTAQADPKAVERILEDLLSEVLQTPIVALHPKDYEALKAQVRTDSAGRFYLPEGSEESERQLCPMDEHVLVCHCGDDYEDHVSSNHGRVLMGCAVCHATPDELTEQAEQAEKAFNEGTDL